MNCARHVVPNVAAQLKSSWSLEPALLRNSASKVLNKAKKFERNILIFRSLLTTITNFVAFCTGLSSNLPALQGFMVYAAAGVSPPVAHKCPLLIDTI